MSTDTAIDPTGKNLPDIRCMLLDIEGTVAPISFVHEVLFPYAAAHLEEFLRHHWGDPDVAAARRLVDPASSEFTEQSLASLKTTLLDLMARDVKSTGLKQLQGLIWDKGYRAGAFQSPVYSDVLPALQHWTAAGKSVAIYSSGSIAAQKVFFRHTTAGDLTPYLSAHFDTTTGPKRSAASYAAIALALGYATAEILFISDIVEEIEAATTAGMRGLIAVRPGNVLVNALSFKCVDSFSALFA
jgi:enolase-phosphatase E1